MLTSCPIFQIQTCLLWGLMRVLLKVVTVSVPPLLDLPPVEMDLSSSTCNMTIFFNLVNILSNTVLPAYGENAYSNILLTVTIFRSKF